MEGPEGADDFIAGGVAALGIEADEIEMSVMRAAHQMFWPAIVELLALDLGPVAPERGIDLSREPA
jgi:hypothetical protein